MNNSFEKPLFVLCYSPSCMHCLGLPELMEEMNRTYKNKDSILFTSIDCQDEGADCNLFPMSGTPYIGLVIGNDMRYWPSTKEKKYEDWINFLNKYTDTNMREVSTYDEIDAIKKEQAGGGSTFVIEFQDKASKFFHEIQQFVQHYTIYNDTFVYKIDPSLGANKIKVFTNEHTFFEIKIKDNFNEITQFIRSNRFGIHHPFESDEFQYTINSRKSIFYIYDMPMSINQEDSFFNLPNKIGDDTIFYGIVSVENKKDVLNITDSSIIEAPFLFGSDPSTGCTWKYYKRIDSLDSEIINELFKCHQSIEMHAAIILHQKKVIIYSIGFLISLFLFFRTPRTSKRTGRKAE